jgi:hypothetical protein
LEASNAEATNNADQAQTARRDSKDLLRSAARAIASARADHTSNDSDDAAEQEIRALSRFGQESGLMVCEADFESWFSDKKYRIKPGIEHNVVVLPQERIVIKDYDTRLFNEETGEVFYKPAELEPVMDFSINIAVQPNKF